MPPPKSFAARQFSDSVTEDLKPCSRCSWCVNYTIISQSIKRKSAHLASCIRFRQHAVEVLRGTDSSAIIDLRMAMPEDFIQACRELADVGEEEEEVKEGDAHGYAQPIDRASRMELKFAKAIYRSGMPLSSFDTDCWREFFRELAQFKPPPRARLAGSLLEAVYAEVQKEVEQVVETQGRGNYTLNCISDESEAMNEDRITNLSLNTANGQSFHITTTATGSADHSARALFDGMLPRIKKVTKGDLTRWNSLCTDTCATQRKLHELIHQHPETRHVFTILCDSHGLQLLVKVLCHGSKSLSAITYYKVTLVEANLMSSFLRSATKLYALLVERAAEDDKKLRALVLAVVTRWGTQVNVVDALIENKAQLQSVTGQRAFFNSESGRKVLSLIDDESFWLRLEHLHSLLLPIHNAQIASESDRSTVAMVVPRWKDLRSDIAELDIPFKAEALLRLDQRLEKQTTGIHYAAYALNSQAPESYKSLSKREWQLAERFFEATIPSHLHNDFFDQLTEFRGRRGRFSSTFLQQRAHNPDSFWDYAQQYDAQLLAQLALRLLSTPANSVPSERSFSSFNFIQNSFRTCLSTHRIDLLLYIHVNCRALEAHKRERLKRRREIALSEGHARKKLRLEQLEARTTPSTQAIAPWNMTTNEAIERQFALLAPLELSAGYLNDDDDDDAAPYELSSQSLPSAGYNILLSSTPLLPSMSP
ncbi:unnamed protein product [Aureobasidium vineae]|uniref:HAT C-terminal dimerisation domain-containing protein n=1 Tax=Aureobasidium vineae TaxID=2773715 RepID=A0A9N8J9F7_9PEZI|nr:unnamed protein product [Aureobasidium vineae]